MQNQGISPETLRQWELEREFLLEPDAHLWNLGAHVQHKIVETDETGEHLNLEDYRSDTRKKQRKDKDHRYAEGNYYHDEAGFIGFGVKPKYRIRSTDNMPVERTSMMNEVIEEFTPALNALINEEYRRHMDLRQETQTKIIDEKFKPLFQGSEPAMGRFSDLPPEMVQHIGEILYEPQLSVNLNTTAFGKYKGRHGGKFTLNEPYIVNKAKEQLRSIVQASQNAEKNIPKKGNIVFKHTVKMSSSDRPQFGQTGIQGLPFKHDRKFQAELAENKVELAPYWSSGINKKKSLN